MSRQITREVGRLPVGLFGTRFVTGFLLGPVLWGLVPGICTPTAMAGPRGGVKSANTLLVLRVAGDPVGRRQEQRFVTELRLALDGVPVLVVQPPGPGFAGLTLARAPRDPRYWSALAVCRRKAGKWPGAVAAYRKVIKLGSPKASNRARFQAAVLLQDRMGRYRAAAALLRGYLNRRAGLRPLTSEARIRRARSQVALGQTDGARRALLKILQDHAGTTAAVQARLLLRKIGRSQTQDGNPPNKLLEKK